MPHSESSIQCSNPHCLNYNDLKSRFCPKCKTPVIRRYLWATKDVQWSELIKSEVAELEIESPEEIIEQNGQLVTTEAMPKKALSKEAQDRRYLRVSDLAKDNLELPERGLVFSDRIFLDTQPGKPPQIPDRLTADIVNHLQLFSFFPYIPQVYGQLDGTDIWLLDYGTVPTDREGKLLCSDLLPTMTSLWGEVPYTRQVKWLRQIVSLWKPLQEKNLVATLLNPQLIRVNGSLIQLIELEVAKDTQPTIQDLGKFWQELARDAHPNVKDVLLNLSQRMAVGSIDRIEQIIEILDRTLDLCAQSHDYSYEMFAISDSGPTRKNNQDSAYPDSELPTTIENGQPSLTIVCDGVGGHEGGEIASSATVDSLRKSISTIDWNSPECSPAKIFKQLIKFTNEANDEISRRNDSEQRQERQRMGTTLVMSLARNHEVYLTHIGDSRIYLITKNSCHQITIDDDLASREVRLGYAVYRDALRYPSAGSLIQALGMRDSEALHQNVERLLVDDECLLLLCSDGLSDFDRVEQYWRDVIVPVLDGKLDLKKSVQTLVKIGSKRNGHDNITAALVHCRVCEKLETSISIITWSEIERSMDDSILWTDGNLANSTIDPQEDFAPPETIIDEGEKKEEIIIDVSEKEKVSFLPIIVALGIAFTLSLGVLLHANLKNRHNSPENSLKSQIIWMLLKPPHSSYS